MSGLNESSATANESHTHNDDEDNEDEANDKRYTSSALPVMNSNATSSSSPTKGSRLSATTSVLAQSKKRARPTNTNDMNNRPGVTFEDDDSSHNSSSVAKPISTNPAVSRSGRLAQTSTNNNSLLTLGSHTATKPIPTIVKNKSKVTFEGHSHSEETNTNMKTSDNNNKRTKY